MSLFGSSPDQSGLSAPQARSEQKSSLFEDEQGMKKGASLFDDEASNKDSPWSMPTPKKAARGDAVKTLLPASDVPESYIDAFDILGRSEHKAEGGKVGIGGVRKILESSRLDRAEQARTLKLVAGDENAGPLGRSEFNVLLALIGLSQENEEASLDSVDERRKGKLFYSPSVVTVSSTYARISQIFQSHHYHISIN